MCHSSGCSSMGIILGIVSVVKIQQQRAMIRSVTPCKSKMICKTGMVFSAQLIAPLLKQLELGHRIRAQIKFRLDNSSGVAPRAAATAAVVSCCGNSWSWKSKKFKEVSTVCSLGTRQYPNLKRWQVGQQNYFQMCILWYLDFESSNLMALFNLTFEG